MLSYASLQQDNAHSYPVGFLIRNYVDVEINSTRSKSFSCFQNYFQILITPSRLAETSKCCGVVTNAKSVMQSWWPVGGLSGARFGMSSCMTTWLDLQYISLKTLVPSIRRELTKNYYTNIKKTCHW